jgi:hypothetical protein
MEKITKSLIMKKKSVFGALLTSLSIGALVYLYFGFYKPRQDVAKEFEQGTKK